jgi:hypothetical protein
MLLCDGGNERDKQEKLLGRTPMTLIPASQRPPDVSKQQMASRDLIKQIRKLRWIGMDDEARRLRVALYQKSAADVVLDLPPETD